MSRGRIPTVAGKKAEMRFVSALIERDFIPFIPVVDLGIDVIAEKFSEGQPPKYFAFQVKTSSFSSKYAYWYWYINKDSFRCAKNVFYVLVFEDAENFPKNIKADPQFNACIIPSKEICRSGHWTTYKGGQSFDVTITVNMLKHIRRFSKRATNSGIALRHFNRWSNLNH